MGTVIQIMPLLKSDFKCENWLLSLHIRYLFYTFSDQVSSQINLIKELSDIKTNTFKEIIN